MGRPSRRACLLVEGAVGFESLWGDRFRNGVFLLGKVPAGFEFLVVDGCLSGGLVLLIFGTLLQSFLGGFLARVFDAPFGDGWRGVPAWARVDKGLEIIKAFV